jgi:Cu/Zn superoxide dismutase
MNGPLTVVVDLSGLEGGAGGYHVHSFPMSSGCGVESTGGHFLSGAGVDIGDLSGKHGSLAGLDSVTKTFEDSDLTLFGPQSIIGRSIVIHRNEDGNPRWVCANIGYPREVKTVVANFLSSDGTGGVEGTITLKQVADASDSETSVLVDLWYADEVAATTTSHKWHVHQELVREAGADACEAASTGGHWNPNDLDIAAGVYSCDGSSFERAVDTCEVGDLSGKHGGLSLVSLASGGKVFYTDVNLPLSGPNSVAGRSIVVHADNLGGPRIACGSLNMIDVQAVADGGSGDDNAAILKGPTFAGIVGAFAGVILGFTGAVAWFAVSRRRNEAAASGTAHDKPALSEALSPRKAARWTWINPPCRNLEEGCSLDFGSFSKPNPPPPPSRVSSAFNPKRMSARLFEFVAPPSVLRPAPPPLSPQAAYDNPIRGLE